MQYKILIAQKMEGMIDHIIKNTYAELVVSIAEINNVDEKRKVSKVWDFMSQIESSMCEILETPNEKSKTIK